MTIRTLRTLLAATLLAMVSIAVSEPVPRATFTEVTSYGDNPTGTKMYLYVPNNLAAKPAIVVGIHWCSGSASAYYQGSWWASYSETYGFIVIYPETPYTSDHCWDVSSQAALTHGGRGDSNSIANMVTYTIAQYGADPSRVFVTGISSGAMMTNVMAAAYPDMFAAGIAYAGVPAGCFYSQANVEDQWNMTCSTGASIATQEHWANVVRNMYPGYSGRYPRMQIYHGDVDAALNVQNFYETVKQWTGIWGYSSTPKQTLANTPASPYTKYVYGPNVEGILGAGIGHSINVFPTDDLKWFGFLSDSSSTTTLVTKTTTSTTTATSTTSPPKATQTHWGQCGGIGWTGPTACESPYTCTYLNDWYYQCL